MLKVDGKSVYYYWYKMNESQREEFIKKLIMVLEDIHAKEHLSYDWVSSIKERILLNFNKTTVNANIKLYKNGVIDKIQKNH